MRFVPKNSVGVQLTLSILLVILLSWVLSSATSYYMARGNVLALRHEMLAHPETYPNPIPEPRFNFLDFLLGTPQLGPRQPGPPRNQPGPREFGQGPGEPFTQPGMEPPQGPPPDGGPGQQPPPPRNEPPPRRLSLPNALARSAIALGLAIVAGLLLGRHFTRPLNDLANGARAYHAGKFGHRIPAAGEDEFTEVAQAMNEMAAQVSRQIGRLEEDKARRQHLLADVAHELRNPAMTLRTMSGALQEGLAADPERRELAVAALVRGSDHLLHLVTDLLELARLDLHELPMHPQPVDARALAAACLQARGAAAERAGITLQPVEDGPPLMVTADPDRLTQVLDNLLDNAISYAGQGATVQVALAGGNPARITVADNGCGIPAAHLPYLFDAFYRVDRARSRQDAHSGLGLRITRSLVEAHGGTLALESAEGKGTRVTVTLPVAG